MAYLLPAFILFFALIYRVLFFYGQGASAVGVIPDDAFYYLVLAEHYVDSNHWTFDGVNASSGFHILYAYLLVGMMKVLSQHGWHELFLLVSILASISISSACLLVILVVKRNFGVAASLLAACPFFVVLVTLQSTNMMESWLVIFMAALSLYLIFGANSSSYKTIFFVGALGTVARSDFGLLPAGLFLAVLLFYGRAPKSVARNIFCLLGGAFSGLFFVVLHNLMLTGDLSQGSAQVKLYWSEVSGHSVVPILDLILAVAIPFGSKLLKVSLIAGGIVWLVSVLVNRLRVGGGDTREASALILLLGTFITLLLYVIFYRQNSQALQNWYSANLVVPIAVVLGAFGSSLAVNRFAKTLIVIFSVYCIIVGFRHLKDIPWPPQLGMLNAARELRDSQINTKIGAWNAGILRYFSGKDVVNIDGLVNSAAIPYIKSGSLLDYLAINNIAYLADYAVMLEDQTAGNRGGYSAEQISRCYKPLRQLDGREDAFGGTHLFLFKLTTSCLPK